MRDPVLARRCPCAFRIAPRQRGHTRFLRQSEPRHQPLHRVQSESHNPKSNHATHFITTLVLAPLLWLSRVRPLGLSSVRRITSPPAAWRQNNDGKMLDNMTAVDILAYMIIMYCATLMATVYYHLQKDEDK